MATITPPASIPDTATLAGVFLAARMTLAIVPEFENLDPLAMLRAMPGDHHADTVIGPDGERWLHYVFIDGSSLIHDGWGYHYLAVADAPDAARTEIGRRMAEPTLVTAIVDAVTERLREQATPT